MRRVAVAAACSLWLTALEARADLSAPALLDALGSRSEGSLAEAFQSAAPGRYSFLVRGSSFASGEERVRVVGDYYVARGNRDSFSGWAESSTREASSWSVPLRMLLDEADGWTRASAARGSTGLRGEGVYIGIVDSGVDASHPDLRNADGTTRIAWLIDFARDPAGLHPELEARYGCNSPSYPCRVLGASDIDDLLQNGVQGDEPLDRYGHGTHVASLAAGNGLSGDEPVYLGTAPSASLVVAQAAGPGGVIDQANVLLATSFIFERARDDGVPAVANISLGTDFGAHDGSSVFEQALASFVGPGEPGRAIVVAAGNSALQARGLNPAFPEPFGAHTEARVNRTEPTRVPLLTASGGAETRASVFVWLHTLANDELTLRFDDGAGHRSSRVAPGTSSTLASSDWSDPDDYEVLIINSPLVPEESFGVTRGSAVLVMSGTWASGRNFEIVLEGEGNASLWVEGSRGLARSSTSGVFFPRASKQGTITVPATHPELLAVGATLNRTGWVDAEGTRIDAGELSSLSRIAPDAVGAFSSAGPTELGVLKPELVAPGINVVGAMSDDADPRDSARSVFHSGGACPSGGECLVVDEHHAVNSGTSMASPIAAGAIALMMQREPELTSDRARHYLMAGSRALAAGGEEQQRGMGALDVEGALAIQDLAAGSRDHTRDPSRERSRFVLADSVLRPEPRVALEAWLLLRDEEGEPSDPAAERVVLEAAPVEDASLDRMAPGLWRVRAFPEPDSGGERLLLRVLVGGNVVAERRVPIAVDRHAASPGFSARGGCSFGSHAPVGSVWLPWLAVFWGFARRPARAHKTAR